MTDETAKITAKINSVTEAAPRPEVDPSQAEIVQSYLEKYFNIALSASCAADGSIEFYTPDGKLFAKVDPSGSVSVESADSSYHFSTGEILAAQKPQESSANTCEPEESEHETSEPNGKKVIVNGDYAGVEDYDWGISLPADVAVDVYTEEEIVELERASGEDLRRAAKRYAESAPSRARASEASSARETRSESRNRPREADTNSPHDEVSVSAEKRGDDIGAAPAPEVVSQGGAVGVEQAAPSGVSPAPFTPAGAENTSANLGAGQVASALHFAPPQNQAERPPEKKGIVPDRGDSNPVRPLDRSGQFVASAARFVDVRDFSPIPETSSLQTPRARPNGAREAIAGEARRGLIPERTVANAGQSAPAGARRRVRAPLPARQMTASGPRPDGEKIGQKAADSAIPIEVNPAAIAIAGADKGGMPPVTPRTAAGASAEIEQRPRFTAVNPASKKRDTSDGQQGRRDRDDEQYPFDEDEQYTV